VDRSDRINRFVAEVQGKAKANRKTLHHNEYDQHKYDGCDPDEES